MQRNWMIYGANGYTGKLIADEAKRRGLNPILAGRSVTGPNVRRFDLNSPTTVIENLKDISLVLNCAGPFIQTANPILDACLKTKSSYMDITGEIEVFESIFKRSQEFENANITVIPGVGFDVVPTDCVASLLKAALPTATHLTLAFKSKGTTSRGTQKTAINGLAIGALVRSEGVIKRLPLGAKLKKINFSGKEETALLFQWGDISTAYQSTQIPNIEIYLAMPHINPLLLLALRTLGLAAHFAVVKTLLKRAVDKRPPGANAAELKSGETIVWGEVHDGAGKTVQKKTRTSHAYQFTVDAALASVEKFLQGSVLPGALTPSKAFGPEFVFTIPGTIKI